MTRQQAIEKYKHEFAGFVLDAATAGRSGGELSLWLRTAVQRIDAKIGAMFDEITAPEDKPATNGVPHKSAASPPAAYPRRA